MRGDTSKVQIVIEYHIVFRVAIIRDQSAAIIVAGGLDRICTNLVDWSVESLSIFLNDSFSG